MLFVPGSDERKLGKIGTLPAQALLLDLEDGVAAGAKAQARVLIAEALDHAPAEKHLWVRVNAADTAELYDDLHAVVRPGLEGINLPKVESERDLAVVDWLIGELERRRDLPLGSVTLMATLETAKGVARAGLIAACTPRLRGLCFGAADYSRDLGLDWPPEGGLSLTVLQAKVALVQASAAAGLEAPHDGASAEFRDLERLRSEARAARDLGFGGKHAIHPAQLPVIEAAFAPSAAQLAWAERVTLEFDRHAAAGIGAFALDGRMIDAPVAARAREVLRQAGRSG
ncbi:HpcH/HpaI aldolase/citrate lyase family protein [Deinococcus apachensis]|uniref:HpcH/HpaI aldolase/citrate lyase family protein n=1 Tax=Deinococcus apachensis TaxID=309886 RepID=UPI0003A31EBC|nr:CoA ester lyase [Deinococcus apachensis]